MIISVLLVIEHLSVSHENLKKVNFAAYNLNQIISLTFLIMTVLDIFV